MRAKFGHRLQEEECFVVNVTDPTLNNTIMCSSQEHLQIFSAIFKPTNLSLAPNLLQIRKQSNPKSVC